jgi:hypothetical protein
MNDDATERYEHAQGGPTDDAAKDDPDSQVIVEFRPNRR